MDAVASGRLETKGRRCQRGRVARGDVCVCGGGEGYVEDNRHNTADTKGDRENEG